MIRLPNRRYKSFPRQMSYGRRLRILKLMLNGFCWFCFNKKKERSQKHLQFLAVNRYVGNDAGSAVF